jgi:NAD(P) transhydrogenase
MREALLRLSGFYYQGSNDHVKDVLTMADLNFRVQCVIENEVAVIQDQLQRNCVDLLDGRGPQMVPGRQLRTNGDRQSGIAPKGVGRIE